MTISAEERAWMLTGELTAVLDALDIRLRECIELGLSAAEAYDSYYQDEVRIAMERAAEA